MPTNPTSPKQLAANRANAARSTGPRTPLGKARAAQNSRRHGFTASTFAVVRLEDLQELAHLKDDLVAFYQPANSQELFALERMALAQQTLLRAARLEVGLFTCCLDRVYDPCGDPIRLMTPELLGHGDLEVTRAQNRNFALAQGFHRLTRESNSWALLLRYQAQAERLYRRALEDFQRLRAPAPPAIPNEAISGPEPQPDPPPGRRQPPSPLEPDPALLQRLPELGVGEVARAAALGGAQRGRGPRRLALAHTADGVARGHVRTVI